MVKSTYGADPASVAYDAVAFAKAHNIDVVLIDSAGRQETNIASAKTVRERYTSSSGQRGQEIADSCEC